MWTASWRVNQNFRFSTVETGNLFERSIESQVTAPPVVGASNCAWTSSALPPLCKPITLLNAPTV